MEIDNIEKFYNNNKIEEIYKNNSFFDALVKIDNITFIRKVEQDIIEYKIRDVYKNKHNKTISKKPLLSLEEYFENILIKILDESKNTEYKMSEIEKKREDIISEVVSKVKNPELTEDLIITPLKFETQTYESNISKRERLNQNLKKSDNKTYIENTKKEIKIIDERIEMEKQRDRNKNNISPSYLNIKIIIDSIENNNINDILKHHEIQDIIYGNGNNILHIACFMKNLDIVKKLLDNGFNINSVNNDNNTALHISFMHGSKEIIQYLLYNNVDTGIINKNNETAFDVVCNYRADKEVCKKNILEEIVSDYYYEINTKKIDKILHFIWIGTKPIPKLFVKYFDRWRKLYPDYKIWLWTDDIVNRMKLYNQKEFNISKGQYSKQSDILRFEILYHYGGIYIDSDCIPLRKMPNEVFNYEFIGVSEGKIIATAFFGCTAKNDIMRHVVIELKINFYLETEDVLYQTGPKFLNRIVRKYYNKRNIKIYDTKYFLGVEYGESNIKNKLNESIIWHYGDMSWKDVKTREYMMKKIFR